MKPFKKKYSEFRAIGAFISSLSLGLALPACAQQDLESVEIRAEKAAEGVSVLFGAGGNIAVSHGADGTILVDDQFAPLSAKIEAAVAALGASPVKWLINTHWHGDHSGGNENFGKAGAMIMAHDHVRERMASEQKIRGRVTPASPAIALPVLTYHNGIALHLNGDTIQIIHAPHAHTDGDSILHWKKANVIHMGDTYFHQVTLPFIDLESGGSVRGMVKAVSMALAMADEETLIIPGHGPLARKSDLAAYRAMLVEVSAAVRKACADGKSLEEIQAMKLAAKWDTNPQAFIKGDTFVASVYHSLANPPAHRVRGKDGDGMKEALGPDIY